MSQNIPQGATKLKKLTKIAARYIELEQFKDSDHHTGYSCYNCIYFMKPHHCAIVSDEGQDIKGQVSGEIVAHGYAPSGSLMNKRYDRDYYLSYMHRMIIKNRSIVHLGKVNDNINPTLLIDMKYNRMSENLINKQKNCFPGFALG